MNDFSKCSNCGSEDLEKYNIDYIKDDDGSILPAEYSVKCKECGEYVGSFSYGIWEY